VKIQSNCRSGFTPRLFDSEVKRVAPNALPGSGPSIHALGSTPSTSPAAAFTLLELLIGLSLSLMVMTAVLTTYVSLGRNFTRSLGLSSANQPNLESQSRRTLATFAQDVRGSSGLALAPTATSLTLTVPITTGTKTVSYYINATAAPVTVTLSGYSTTVPAQSLARVDGGNGATLTLQSSLQVAGTNTFSYYDSSGYPYTTYVNYLRGIKQVSLTVTAQAGSSTNGTLTETYVSDSPRLLFRNRPFLL
jgi:Tfp pilus assembly protein PilW